MSYRRAVVFLFLVLLPSFLVAQDDYSYELDIIYHELQDISNNTYNNYNYIRTTLRPDILSGMGVLDQDLFDLFTFIANHLPIIEGSNASLTNYVWQHDFRSQAMQEFYLSNIVERLGPGSSDSLAVQLANLITNSISLKVDFPDAIAVTNVVSVFLDQQLEGHDWLSYWGHDTWVQTLFLTNTLPSLISNLSSSSSASIASISNLVDNWHDIFSVPGWQISGRELSLEAWLSEFLSEWNRSFYAQTIPPQTPFFNGPYTLLNWWGTDAILGPEEDNARYAFSDWIADAFRYFIENGSNMVVESYQPYATSSDASGNGQYQTDWETNLNKAAYSRSQLEPVDTTGVEGDLTSYQDGLSEAFGKLNTENSSVSSTSLKIIPEFSVAGHSVQERSFDFASNEITSDFSERVGSVMVLVWNFLGLFIGFSMINSFWKVFTQL